MKSLLAESYLLGQFLGRLAFGRLLDMPETFVRSSRRTALELLGLLGAPATVQTALDRMADPPGAPVAVRAVRAEEFRGRFFDSVAPIGEWVQSTFGDDHVDAFTLGFLLFHAVMYAQQAAQGLDTRAGLVAVLDELPPFYERLRISEPTLRDAQFVVQTSRTGTTLGMAARPLVACIRKTLLALGGAHLTALAAR